MSKRVRIDYYAYFRDRRGLATEEVETQAGTLADLYRQTAAEHGFALPIESVKAIVGDEFRPMSDPLDDGTTVVFVPPVAGG
jgi:molybdopterin converting factor small subunit